MSQIYQKGCLLSGVNFYLVFWGIRDPLLFHFSFKLDFFIVVDMVMCHALKKSTSH
jgi:hypothetical protein